VLFGSDWPFSMGLSELHRQLADIDADLRCKIFRDEPKALGLF
jgi:aminocarboxymuconate-semialdehyde decarboxylase